MTSWQQALAELSQTDTAHALITIIGVEGSAPRDAGTKMVVTADQIVGSIGGGNLEHTCVNKVRELLQLPNNSQVIEYYPLSAKFNQCCSGAVSVMFESFVSVPNNVVIFGAGHVAKELSLILPRLGCRLTLIDQRKEQLGGVGDENIKRVHSDNPLKELANISPASYVLIMTHDHKLDYELCCKALKDFDFEFLGLIGSRAKSEKFKSRMLEQGFDTKSLIKLTSPIGLKNISGKKPMEVAISASAQLLSLFHADEVLNNKHKGISMKDALRIKTFTSQSKSRADA